MECSVSANEEEFENAIKTTLSLMGEDPSREGLLDTPKRVRKSYDFLCGGYKEDPKEILLKAMFSTDNDEMVLVKDIEFYSLCEHHMLPFFGRAHVAYIPDGKVVGLSKIPRLVEVFARRLQIQEQLTSQIAETMMEVIKPKGVAVVLEARHMCMEMRGVQKYSSATNTSALKGQFMSDARTRAEFYDLVNAPRGQRY